MLNVTLCFLLWSMQLWHELLNSSTFFSTFGTGMGKPRESYGILSLSDLKLRIVLPSSCLVPSPLISGCLAMNKRYYMFLSRRTIPSSNMSICFIFDFFDRPVSGGSLFSSSSFRGASCKRYSGYVFSSGV